MYIIQSVFGADALRTEPLEANNNRPGLLSRMDQKNSSSLSLRQLGWHQFWLRVRVCIVCACVIHTGMVAGEASNLKGARTHFVCIWY